MISLATITLARTRLSLIPTPLIAVDMELTLLYVAHPILKLICFLPILTQGIIAAQPGNPYNITGAAYGVDLNVYRVFGCEGSVTEEVLVDALIKGYKDGNDILTMSLGGADGWATSSSAVVSDRLAKLGKIVTIAAGNDGAVGSWYSSAPGNAYNAISVASVEKYVFCFSNFES